MVSLRETMDLAQKALENAGGASMNFEEYLDFLDEYWSIFGPPPEHPLPGNFEKVKI